MVEAVFGSSVFMVSSFGPKLSCDGAEVGFFGLGVSQVPVGSVHVFAFMFEAPGRTQGTFQN